MYFKNKTNLDVHVKLDKFQKRNAKGNPIGRSYSVWGFIRAGETKDIKNDAIRGAQKNMSLEQTTMPPEPSKVIAQTIMPPEVAKTPVQTVRTKRKITSDYKK